MHPQPTTPSDEVIWDLNWSMMVLADRLTDSLFHSPKFRLNFKLIFPNSRLAPVEELGLSLKGTQMAAGRVALSPCRGNATILTRPCGIFFFFFNENSVSAG